MKRLGRKLELEGRVRGADGSGGFTGGWATLGTLWGAVEPSTGRLERGEDAARSRGSYRVTVRAVPEGSSARPAAGQRFRAGARVLAIRAVLDTADARYLTCYCDEEALS